MRSENKAERHREYVRKLIHVIFGTLILFLISIAGTTASTCIIGLLLVLGVILSIGMMRGHRFPWVNDIVATVERDNEKHFPGKAALFFFLSTLVLLILFKESPALVLAALSVQVFADSFAAIIGKRYGKIKLRGNKSLEGSITCFVVASICISYFQPIPIALITALVATIVELFPLDDNLWVPLISGVTIRLLTG